LVEPGLVMRQQLALRDALGRGRFIGGRVQKPPALRIAVEIEFKAAHPGVQLIGQRRSDSSAPRSC
jgi:hypothetical protein